MTEKRKSLRSFAWFLGLISVLLGGAAVWTYVAEAQADDTKADTQTRVLTNGRLAAIRRTYGPSPEIYLYTMDPDGTNATAFPLNGFAQPDMPSWSPDGTKLVYSGTPGDIFVINADGSGSTNLTNTAPPTVERNPTWSVNGKIAYAVNEPSGTIWTMNTNGTGQAQFSAITQPFPFDPAWSPDGAKLAFVSAGEIWVINADGTGEQRLTNNATTDRDPAWSPDGTKIVFTRTGAGLATVNSNGTGEAPLTSGSSDQQPSWSPDGTKIAFRGSGGMWTMEAGGQNKVLIQPDIIHFPLCCDYHFENPAWQPFPQVAGTYSISGRVSNNGLPLANVTVDLTGTARATTTTDSVGNFQFSGLAAGGNFVVSPAKLRYYFTPPNRTFQGLSANQFAAFDVAGVCSGARCVRNGKIAYTRSNEIFTSNPDGSGEVNVTNNAAVDSEPSYSPDGAMIAFTTDRDGNSEIYKMAADGSGAKRLTNSAGADTSPNYSPDGGTIVFVSARDGNNEIYKMNADGTGQVRLTNNSINDASPAFTPDGKIIWTASNSPTRVYKMNPDGSDQQQFVALTGFSPTYERFSFTPDGSKIMFTHSPDATSVYRSTYTMNANGTGAALFPAGGAYGTYSSDGTLAAYTCCIFDNTHRLRTSDAAGTQSTIKTIAGNTTGNGQPDWQPIALPNVAPSDFDGDGRTDLAVLRPSNGVWYIMGSTAGFSYRQWSDPGDILTPADYDGDRKTDLAVWRPSNGTFYIINSFDNTYRGEVFGNPTDVPTGGDWDGDGKADPAVYRDGVGGTQSFFYYRGSMGNPQNITTFVPWGTTGDKPAVGDFDGDGRTDATIYRGGDWWVLNSSTQTYTAIHFGVPTDKVVPADYDGDGKADMAVYRDGTWFLLRSRDGFAGFGFGNATDQPSPGDYDGDGKIDAAIFRDGTWWILNSSNSQPVALSFGSPNDRAIPGAFVR